MDEPLVDEAQLLVDRLAARLRQSVAVDDPDGNLIVVSRHFGDADPYRVRLMLDRRIPLEHRDYFTSYTRKATTSPVRIPPNPQLSVAARVCFPIRSQDSNVAYLWLLDLDKALPLDLIERYCARLADVLSARREREVPPSAAFRLDQTIRKLLSGARPSDILRDDGAESVLTTDRYVAIANYSAPTRPGQLAQLRTLSQQVAVSMTDLGITAAYAGELDGCAVAVFRGAPSDDGAASRIVDWLLDETSRRLRVVEIGSGWGIGEFGELGEIRQLFARAAQAAFLCAHLFREESVLSWEQVRPLAALAAADPSTDPGRSGALAALLGDPESFAFDTVAAVLRSSRDNSPADLLLVHRTTLHYRLQQIVELTGVDLAVPADRFLAFGVWLRVALRKSPLADLVITRSSTDH